MVLMTSHETSLTLFPYTIILQEDRKKRGLLLLVETESGQKGWGDISPLEGFSTETYDEALEVAQALREKIYHKDLTPLTLPPSVHFGYEMALHQIQRPLTQDITDVHITTLLQGDASEILSKPTLKNVKLKLGNHNLDTAFDLVDAYRETHNLRIDFNGQWPLGDVYAFCRHYKAQDFVYLEDPVADPKELEEFLTKTQYPVALDALSLRMTHDAIRNLPGEVHVILKPTLIGGYSICKQWIEALHPIPCHFSSAFESRVGHLHILRMAKELTNDTSIGIGTYAYIEQDILPNKLRFTTPVIAKELYNNMLYDPSQLLSPT